MSPEPVAVHWLIVHPVMLTILRPSPLNEYSAAAEFLSGRKTNAAVGNINVDQSETAIAEDPTVLPARYGEILKEWFT